MKAEGSVGPGRGGAGARTVSVSQGQGVSRGRRKALEMAAVMANRAVACETVKTVHETVCVFYHNKKLYRGPVCE